MPGHSSNLAPQQPVLATVAPTQALLTPALESLSLGRQCGFSIFMVPSTPEAFTATRDLLRCLCLRLQRCRNWHPGAVERWGTIFPQPLPSTRTILQGKTLPDSLIAGSTTMALISGTSRVRTTLVTSPGLLVIRVRSGIVRLLPSQPRHSLRHSYSTITPNAGVPSSAWLPGPWGPAPMQWPFWNP